MESLFFNTPTQRYKTTEIFKNGHEHLTKVDISNGIFFYDISLQHSPQTIKLKNLDRMVMMCVVKKGDLSLVNHIEDKTHQLKENSIAIYCSSRQDFSLTINSEDNAEIFILFIADFFLKQYLNFKTNDPVDFLYTVIQDEIILKQINLQPIDALSLYIIDKIIKISNDINMHSMRCVNHVLEFVIHRFELLDMVDEKIEKQEREIASRAKDKLLETFVNPPTIEVLAHLCATNESKLKKVFKKVYKTTIYGFVQKLRLQEANLLLKEQYLNIGEIAKKVGYKHQGYFTKLFFETYGVYPKDLLKR